MGSSSWAGAAVGISPDGIAFPIPSKSKTKNIMEQISKLVSIESEILSETNAELLEQFRRVEGTRDRLLKAAEANLTHQKDSIEKLYEYECEDARQMYENAKEALEEKYLAEIQDKLKRLEHQRDGGGDVTDRMTTRTLRSKAKVELDEKSNSGNNRKKRQTTMFPPLTKELDDEDILLDLKSMEKAVRKANAQASRENEVIAEPGKLRFRGQELRKGDDVIVRSERIKEDFYGTITSVNEKEVFVKLKDGSTSRVPLIHLRSHRCSISLRAS